MSRSKLYALVAAVSAIFCALYFSYFYTPSPSSNLPVVAIANYGPHQSLNDTLEGIQQGLKDSGYEPGVQIHLEVSQVDFQTALIPQMIAKLKASNPRVLVALSTPIAQAAKARMKGTPLVFACVTDPVESGLLKEAHTSIPEITGASDLQDLDSLLTFIKKIQPAARTLGMLYGTGEANDVALFKRMTDVVGKYGLELVAISVEQASDIPLRMQGFKGKIDALYVGTSGTIQPALPVIASIAKSMNTPVYNADVNAVRSGLVMGSCGVNYGALGRETGRMIAQILKGTPLEKILPFYPQPSQHKGTLNLKKVQELGISITADIADIDVIP